jgi:16S rRNA (guanine(966)-N(2))-methyltransferase RsmD
VRVTGGRLRGRRIGVPPGRAVRPTADRVRESLFARLGSLDGCHVLDLYAGSGALGIEALSRGAARAVFVERAAPAAAALRANLAALGLEEHARVLRGDAALALRRLARERARFDLALLDPPYGPGGAERALRAVADAAVMAPGGTVVVEASRRHPPGDVAGFVRGDERVHGDTVVVRYEAPGGGGGVRSPTGGTAAR